jgi:putative hydrolase of the HAD superfamily
MTSEERTQIRVVFFDLGDTLICEQSLNGKSLLEAELKKLPSLDEVLAELKEKGFKLGIITNTVVSREEHVREALRRMGIERYFDVVVTSVDVGHEKPDIGIFLEALSSFGVRPQEALMVGNRISKDIVGGNRVGMKTVLLKWNERYQESITSPEEMPTYIINSLKELPKILAENLEERAGKKPP